MGADVAKILEERGNRYGNFLEHAIVCQSLKTVINNALGHRGKWLAPDQRQSLEVICDKIARIINGDPDYEDNWVDIAGYAQLIVNRLQEGTNER